MNRRAISLALGLSPLLFACSAPKKPNIYPEYFIEADPKFTIIIGELELVNKTQFTYQAPHVEHEVKQLTPQLFNQILQKRFIKQGLLGKMTMVIEDFSITEEIFTINQSLNSLFSSEAGSRFTAHWLANIIVDAPQYKASLTIEVNDQATIGKNASYAMREKELYDLGGRMITKFNQKISELIPQHLTPIISKAG